MSYIGQIPLPQATEERIERTATSGQTSFTGLTYVNGHISVYLNGVKLDNADFTATDGTTVTLGTGAAAGDTVSFVSTTQTSALVALPLKDSAGNAVLSESGGVVTLGNATLATSVVGSIQGFGLYTLSSDISSNSDVTGLTLQNSAPFTSKGSLITESSGVISFNSTGVYQILGSWAIHRSSTGSDTIIIYTKITTDGSTFTTQFRNQATVDDSILFNRIPTLAIINCTDTSSIKFKFSADSLTTAIVAGGGPGTNCYTQIIVMKIG